MYRTILMVSGVALLAGCNLYQSEPEGAVQAPTPVPEAVVIEPLVCPEPEPLICDCPEPEKVVIPAPPPEPCTVGKREIMIIGGIERVEVDDTGLTVKARIDTGAKTSSLHAEELVEFERDGKTWVRFKFDPGEKTPAVTIEKPVVRKVRIKQHLDDYQRRYVIKLRLRMGELEEIIEVSLSDRSDFEYPILIGRNFLTDNAVVDVSKQFVAD